MSQKRHKRLKKLVTVAEQVAKQGEETFEGLKESLIRNWWSWGALLIVAVVIYINGMAADFVSDDYATITQNPNVADFGYMSKGFLILNLIHWATAKMFGVASPIPWHIVSLGLYLISILLMWLFIKLIANEKIALLSGIVFAVLPIHVEAVTWISGKPYLLNSIGLFSMLILLAAYGKSGKMKYLYWLIPATILAFFMERIRFLAIGFILPMAVISLPEFGKVKKVVVALVAAAIIVSPFLVPLAKQRIESVNGGINSSAEGVYYNPLFQYPTAIAKYMQLMIFPVDLTLYHTMYIFPQWLNWVILLTYLIMVGYFFFANKLIFFGLTFILAAAAPSMAPVKVSWLVAERYMYLGTAGMALVLGIILEKIISKNKMAGLSLLGLVVSLYSVRVVLRNIDWQTNHNLWVNTCQVSPNSHNAWNNIGDDYDKLKQYENAVKGFTQSTVIKPNYADAYHNRANIFFKMQRLDLARNSYMTALSYSPNLYQTYLSLTQIDLMEKKFDEALSHMNMAIKIYPSSQNYLMLANVYAVMGDKGKATEVVKFVLNNEPNNMLAKQMLQQLM